MGKTRILAAIIYNEYLKGHKRHLFLSISEYLFNDLKAEFKKIAPEGWVNNHVKCLKDDFKDTQTLKLYTGVLFTTYRQLRRVTNLFRDKTKASNQLKSLSGLEIIERYFELEEVVRGVVSNKIFCKY